MQRARGGYKLLEPQSRVCSRPPLPRVELDGGVGVTPYKAQIQHSNTPVGMCDYWMRCLR